MVQEKVLVISYYWPPSGGSGVQRWMYFCKYLQQQGITPYVITVHPRKASYKFKDESLLNNVKDIPVFYTNTFEPLKLYSRLTRGNASEGIPQGFAGEDKPGIVKRTARYIRGNWFIPDARKGWNRFAIRKAKEIIKTENITRVITTGPPHSTHLIGLALKNQTGIKWLADFRDPWIELFYNRFFYRTKKADARDKYLEKQVLLQSDAVTTVSPSLVSLLQSKISDNHQKISCIVNGFDHTAMQEIHEKPGTDVFLISHIGMLGDTQPVTSFLQALSQLHTSGLFQKSIPQFHVTGNVSPAIVTEIKKRCPWLGLHITSYVPHTEALRQMKKSHLLLNSQPEIGESTYMISGKLMEYLGSGNPVLVLGNELGDAAKLLSPYAYCGVFSRKNAQGITGFIEMVYKEFLKGTPAMRSGIDLPYSRENTTRQLVQLLQTLK